MLDIVYRDETCIVINKPAGMLVHRTYLDHGETVFAVQQLRDQIGMKVHPVHRLDKPTSGLLMFALNAEALTTLQSQFTKKSVKKVYWAIVRGYLSGNGSLDYPLKREVDSYSQAATAVNQSAVTHYRCLAQTELPVPVGRYPTTRYSWIEIKPETGREDIWPTCVIRLWETLAMGMARTTAFSGNTWVFTDCSCMHKNSRLNIPSAEIESR
jgi:tRNA pseudouridine65 synthase